MARAKKAAAGRQTAAANNEPDPAGKHYDVGRWKKLTRYQCRLCRFDTLGGVQVMLLHLHQQHNLNNLSEPAPAFAGADNGGSSPGDETPDGEHREENES